MSVLNFPRIYLNGHMFWNPPTANNNDVFPLYDAVKTQMNWPFLSHYDINEKNATTQLMPWTITPLAYDQLPPYVQQVPGNGDPSHYPMIPAEWDMFGDNACGTVDYESTHSRIIGGEFQANTYIDQDSLINKNFQLLGNPFGSTAPTPARFVDISPWQNTFTALYFDKLLLGDEHCGLTLNREYRMLDRFLNFNWGAFDQLSSVTTTWQTCFPRDNLHWVVGDSNLLKTLQQEMLKQNAKGLMFRFSTYLTFYDKNGIFNDYPPVDSHSQAGQAQLQAMYQKGLDNVADIFFNPAYSRTAGTLGLWFDDEFPTAPAGRRLMPKSPVPMSRPIPKPSDPENMTLGVISAAVQGDTLSLDLANTFPFYPLANTVDTIPEAEKFAAGSYELGVRADGGAFQRVASFGFEQYQQAAFDKRSGLLDLPLSSEAQSLLQKGSLELQLQSSPSVTAATQQKWTAEVVESGSFIDVGDDYTLNIMVQRDGVPAGAGVRLWVAEYGNAFMLSTSNYYLAFSNKANFTLFQDFPLHRKDNTAALPQFAEAKATASVRTVGSGRTLSAFLQSTKAIDDDKGVAVLYQDYLKTPAAVSLRPCLQFVDAKAMSGTLKDNLHDTVDYSLTHIQTNDLGIAQLKVKAVAPGFPTLRFFVEDNGQQPTVPFSFSYFGAYTDFLSPLRVLPLEPQLQEDFFNCWNSIYQDQNANLRIWNEFIFPRVLQPFYYLYPIMNKFMPLNSLQRIEGAVDQLIVLISKPYQEESTLAMPITRDMPQSRRNVLEIWAKDLVKMGYPPRPLDPADYPQG
ncbi:hypothetical protein [Pseudomonas sp. LD120]|uniref:hypothetical protein n=1 Tax=Pseudomonas sp. LD120 TaxID=485751 RepID=UPI0013586AF2|nr:hypothetical protein [Pseudomonas sp. LD120]KAF0867115.1 hypothetical protein PLD_01200 [Pseudomonas sp. LD120]